MDPVLVNVLIGVAGAAMTVLAHKFGWKIPGLPDAVPAPQPKPQPVPLPLPGPIPDADALPAVDREAMEFLRWAIRAKSGEVKLDALDNAALLSIKPVVDELVSKAQPKV